MRPKVKKNYNQHDEHAYHRRSCGLPCFAEDNVKDDPPSNPTALEEETSNKDNGKMKIIQLVSRIQLNQPT